MLILLKGLKSFFIKRLVKLGPTALVSTSELVSFDLCDKIWGKPWSTKLLVKSYFKTEASSWSLLFSLGVVEILREQKS